MNTTIIPNDKQVKTQVFWLERNGRSDYQLVIDLLDKVSNKVLFDEITSITPEYTANDLVLYVTYNTYA